MLYKKVIFKNQEIENEWLELIDKGSLSFLGYGLTLRSCTIVLKVSGRTLFLTGSRFIDPERAR
ncbi:MAG: hypothetical protein ACXU86_02315 [Archangium sp.]